MAFVIPTFPLLCNVNSHADTPPLGPHRIVDLPCQLRAPSASYIGLLQPSASQTPCMCLLVAAFTDLRDLWTTPFNNSDWVEVPAGTGRWYKIQMVDDIAKGFPNEHRFATLIRPLSPTFPVPIP